MVRLLSATPSRLAMRVDAEQPCPAVSVAGDVAVGRFREPRKGAENSCQRTCPGKDSGQRLGRCTGREQRAVAGDQVPGVEAQIWIHPREEAPALLTLDRDCPESLCAIPGEDLVQRPFAETAILVVEDDALALCRHPVASCGDGTP